MRVVLYLCAQVVKYTGPICNMETTKVKKVSKKFAQFKKKLYLCSRFESGSKGTYYENSRRDVLSPGNS